MADEPISQWISEAIAGHEEAIWQLWQRYFLRLVALAREKLRDFPRRAADEEDVALSAFNSFCRGARAGQFSQLTDRNDLWHLLCAITVHKAIDLRQHEARLKRGGGRVQGESAVTCFPASTNTPSPGLEQVAVDPQPTPEVALQFIEDFQHLMDCLEDTTLQSVAQWKMEGHTNEEIAARLGCVPRTVERKLQLIRGIWTQQSAE